MVACKDCGGSFRSSLESFSLESPRRLGASAAELPGTTYSYLP
jgi:hypothetical protein